MQIIRKQDIDDFLAAKTIVVAGVSRNPKSFSADVVKHLTGLGYKLWLVNPLFEQNELDKYMVKSLSDLPVGLTHLLVLTPKTQTDTVIEQAIQKGFRNIWIQQMSETPAALALVAGKGVKLVYGYCIFMFTNPQGMHKFHYSIKKFFGKMPV